MRAGAWTLAALILSALAAHFLLQDRGYVLVSFRGYVIEMSVPALLVVLLLLYALVRALLAAWRAPRRLGEALADRRARRAGEQLTRGLVYLAEGRWGKGERLLTRGARGAGAPLVNYLLAARAAQLQGSEERRDQWLKIAYEELPAAETAVLVTQAELQVANQEHERALATLQRVLERAPDHPVALALLARTYRELADWRRLVELLPRMGRARLRADELEALAVQALEPWLERKELTVQALSELWSALPGPLRGSAPLICLRALALDRLGRGDEAEKTLRAALKRAWDARLVRAYGTVSSGNRLEQLRRAEGWLRDHPEDGVLLAAAARLAMASELWGKARSYLESSLALAPDPESYALYGRLLTSLGEGDNAAQAYRAGLGLIAGSDLPALEAPPPPASSEAESDASPATR